MCILHVDFCFIRGIYRVKKEGSDVLNVVDTRILPSK
jgi:hypothetical protein